MLEEERIESCFVSQLVSRMNKVVRRKDRESEHYQCVAIDCTLQHQRKENLQHCHSVGWTAEEETIEFALLDQYLKEIGTVASVHVAL